MSKGKFEPGKRVLVLGPCNDLTTIHVVGTECRLGKLLDYIGYPNYWELAGELSTDHFPIAWPKAKLILLDPDESPEQSLEAMRDLMQTKKERVTT